MSWLDEEHHCGGSVLGCHLFEGDASASDLGEDLFGGGGPEEWFRVVVVHAEVVLDRGYQVGDAVEGAAADGFGGDVGEEAFDQVEPGGRGWGEVQVEAGVLGQPGLDVGMAVGAVVVDDHVDGQASRHRGADGAGESPAVVV